MTTYLIAYLLISFAALGVLCKMILHIGTLLGNCPETGTAARAGSVTITTGFAAIGAGGLILISAAIPTYTVALPAVFMLALGLASLCLGLGFTHAIGSLRAVVANRPAPAAPVPAWLNEDKAPQA